VTGGVIKVWTSHLESILEKPNRWFFKRTTSKIKYYLGKATYHKGRTQYKILFGEPQVK
jgi:hypothetical protein